MAVFSDNPGLLEAWSLSPDGNLLAIVRWNGEEYNTLINLANGTLLRDEVVPQSSPSSDDPLWPVYDAGKWQDNTHLYLSNIYSGSPMLVLLDTAKGQHQQPDDLQPVLDMSDTACWDYDPSTDGKTLFVVHCQSSTDAHNNLTFSGPSLITVQNPLGGPLKVIYHNPTLAISQVRAANSTTLLFNVVHNASRDTSQEGLWAIQTDGSHLTHIMNGHILLGNHCASLDGRFYALSIVHQQTNGYPTYTPMVGSLNGGALISLPFGQDAAYHAIAGWTTM